MPASRPVHSSSAGEEAWAIGIDVGGTKIAGGLVRLPGGAHASVSLTNLQVLSTRPERGPVAVLADVVDLARHLFGHVPRGMRCAGIGIGVPELVDLQGRITSGHTIDWRGLSLAERIAGMDTVCVEADVRAAALAEARFGAGRPYRLFAYVTVGTGISSALVQDGRPFAGARGNAVVLASAPVNTVCPHCGARIHTVLEKIASGPALVRRYHEVRPGVAARCEDVLAAAEAGDTEAARVVREGGLALGGGVAFLVNVLDPEAVVVGGGLGCARGLYWDAFLDSLRRHIWAEATRDLPVVRAELGPDAGAIGAAVAVWLRAAGKCTQ